MNLSAEKPNRRPIRLCSAVYDAIDSEAAYRGEKAGTVANRMLADELNKVAKVGIEYCVVYGSSKYKTITKADREGERWYIIPTKEEIEKHLPSKRMGGMSKQVSFYLSNKHLTLLEEIVRLQNIVKTINMDGEIHTLRFAVMGLLLNNELLCETGDGIMCLQEDCTDDAKNSAKAVAK